MVNKNILEIRKKNIHYQCQHYPTLHYSFFIKGIVQSELIHYVGRIRKFNLWLKLQKAVKNYFFIIEVLPRINDGAYNLYITFNR
jgi:hypothetical protein